MATDIGPGTRVTPSVRLLQPIGSGGMGSVWLAEHTGLGAEVAVKLIRPEQLSRSRSATRFAREASLAARIRSPHVVRVFDHGTMPDETPYIVMEVLHGESLAERIARDRRLPTRLVSLLVTQTAEALRAAHRLGVVHRDIKPGNLFLEESSYELFVKVLDFGIAKDTEIVGADSLTETGGIMGTPYYMSPEQLLAPKEVDARADLWGLSVVAYHALTGELPFRGATVAALAVAIREGPPRPPSSIVPGLPDELDVWFRMALHRDIALRFADAAALADGFDRACQGLPSLDPSSGSHPAALVSPARRSAPTAPRSDASAPGARAATPATGQALVGESSGADLHAEEGSPHRGDGAPAELVTRAADPSTEPPATQSCRMAVACEDVPSTRTSEVLAAGRSSNAEPESAADTALDGTDGSRVAGEGRAGAFGTATDTEVGGPDRIGPGDHTLRVDSGRHAREALPSRDAPDEPAAPSSFGAPNDRAERHDPAMVRRSFAVTAAIVTFVMVGALVAYASFRDARPDPSSTAPAMDADPPVGGARPGRPHGGANEPAPSATHPSTDGDPRERPRPGDAASSASADSTTRAAPLRAGPVVSPAPRAATAVSTGATPTAAPSAPDCSVPFVVDEHGDLHPRRECLH